MDWNVILATVFTNTIFLTILGFVTRSIFLQILSRKLEKFKSELVRENYEYQIRFSNLHEKRAEVIAELYRLLVKVEDVTQNLTISNVLSKFGENRSEDVELLREVAKEISTLKSYFNTNRIYFDEALGGKISSFLNKAMDVITDSIDVGEKDLEGDKDALKQYWNKAMNDLPSIKKDIEEKFRNLLGIS